MTPLWWFFSVADLDSFHQISFFIQKITLIKPTDSPILLVGNKCDCSKEDRKVSVATGQSQALSNGVLYIESSAKLGKKM